MESQLHACIKQQYAYIPLVGAMANGRNVFVIRNLSKIVMNFQNLKIYAYKDMIKILLFKKHDYIDLKNMIIMNYFIVTTSF